MKNKYFIGKIATEYWHVRLMQLNGSIQIFLQQQLLKMQLMWKSM